MNELTIIAIFICLPIIAIGLALLGIGIALDSHKRTRELDDKLGRNENLWIDWNKRKDDV